MRKTYCDYMLLRMTKMKTMQNHQRVTALEPEPRRMHGAPSPSPPSGQA